MSIRWHDVSIPLRNDMVGWPGDPPFRFDPTRRIAHGERSNVSTISLSTHAGTHMDAPWHFEEDGRKLHEIDPGVYFGEALLIELPNVHMIAAADLGQDSLPPRVLFKTRNSDIAEDAPFAKDYVALSADAAQRLVDDGVRLVGVDYLSVAPYKQEGQATHHILLRNNVVVVEGLRLRGFAPGAYPFVVLPLPLADADGAPCRAFLGRADGNIA